MKQGLQKWRSMAERWPELTFLTLTLGITYWLMREQVDRFPRTQGRPPEDARPDSEP